ncbi:MAG: hypothetical protein ACR2LT_02125 [Pyrinomonadaceae bacterium]
MRNIILIIALIFINGICFSLYAQAVMPPGSSDKNLENRDIKARSVELERVQRDTDKKTAEKSTNSKFPEIKEDFEKMQLLNGDLVNLAEAKEINYEMINASSAEMEKRAVRLKSNLFPAAKSKKKSKDKNQTQAEVLPTDLKTLVKTMNSAVLEFTHNPIFQSPKFTGDDSAAALSNLEKIIDLSSAIEKQSEKVK